MWLEVVGGKSVTDTVRGRIAVDWHNKSVSFSPFYYTSESFAQICSNPSGQILGGR